jgi:hypothetical protein
MDIRLRLSLPRLPLAGAAALLAALVLAHGAPARAASGLPAAVEVDRAHPRPPIPTDFLGLSLEVKGIPQLDTAAEVGNLVPLLQNLGGGVLRLGGVTADTQVAWLGNRGVLPPWATVGLRPADLAPLGDVYQETHWKILLTLNVGHLDPPAATDEASAASAQLGAGLLGLELGNEPDAFPIDGLRADPYDFTRYQSDVDVVRASLLAADPSVPIAGPDVASGFGRLSWLEQMAGAEQPALLTAHYYPLSWCHGYLPTVPSLLSLGMHKLLRHEVAALSGVAGATGLPVRLDETNNISCGGEPGVSNTFASALWALDLLTRAMFSPVVGVNFHGNFATPQGYGPIAAASQAALLAGTLTAQPEYYALLLASYVEGDRPLPSYMRPAGLNALTFASLSPHGREHVLVINDRAPGTQPLLVRLAAPAGLRTATLLTLRGPAPDATGGVTLGGAAVTPDGDWQAPAPLPTAPLLRDRHHAVTGVQVRVPASSAVLVTLYSSRR